MPTMAEEKFLSVEDIAKILGKTEESVRRLFRSGELPGVKVGGVWYMRPQDWQDYWKEQQARFRAMQERKRNQNKK